MISCLTKLRGIKRKVKFLWQRLTRGWDDSETWSLDITIAEHALPRLKELKKFSEETLERDDFHKDLAKIIEAFEIIANDNDYACLSAIPEKEKIVKEGLRLFVENYQRMWW